MLGTSKEHNFSIKKFLKGRLYMSNTNTKQLVKKYNLQLQVTDADGNAISFTHENAAQYIQLKTDAITNMTTACKALVKIQEDKLYLMEAYENMKDFVADTFSFSYGTAQKYMSLEKSFGELGVDYGSLPANKLFEIAKDDDKMKALKRVKDPESKLIQFVNELKERDEAAKIEAMKQKKAIKNGEVSRAIPERLQDTVGSLREQLALFKNMLLNPDFDWENKDNLNEIGKLKEDWKAFMGEIVGLHELAIEAVRDERRPIEEAEAAEREAEEEANRRMAIPKKSKKDQIIDAEISESKESDDSEDSDSNEVEDNG